MTVVFAVTTALAPAGSLLRPAFAQTGEPGAPPAGGTRSVSAEEGPDTRPQKTLALQEALSAAVANNLQVEIRRRDPQIADYGVTIEDAVFDPLLAADGAYGKSKTEPLSDFESTGNKFW